MALDESRSARVAHSALPGRDLGRVDVLGGLLGAADDYVLVLDPQGQIIAQNRPGRAQATTLWELFESDGERLQRALSDTLQSGQTRELELASSRLYGGRPCSLRIGALRTGDVISGLVVVATDAPPRQGKEAELVESQNRLRTALGASKVGLWSWEEADNRVHWDAAAMRIFGAERSPRDFDEYIQFVHPDDRKLVTQHVRSALEVGQYSEIEHRIVRPSGEERWVLARGEVLGDAAAKNRRLIGGILDVSERRSMEEKLRQAQKMEALGELTAGLAHNFNNALMAILPNLEQATRATPAHAASLIDVAQQAAERAARLVSELMVFAGGGRSSDRGDEALGTVVQRAVQICRSTFSRQIAVELSLDEKLPVLSFDATQVEHAVMNVCINARDAVEGVSGRRPTIEVEAKLIPGGSAELVGPAAKPERDHARLSVTDNGVGMPEAVRRRIFEPFFTTKEIGKGTGLGLSTSYAIVREHDGFITCESVPDQGTTFRLYLPVEQSGVRKDSRVMALPAPRGSELVLVVDDDPVVRNVTARVLASGGYRIAEASDGSNGLALFERQRDDISLVLLDESMPGIAGHEVLARMLALEPTARVAMFTGVQPAAEHLRGSRTVIRKPIGANDLLWRVRQLIDEP